MVPFGNFGWNFGFGFGWIIVVVTCLLIVAAILQLARMSSARRTRGTELDELDKRYARGDLTREEYEAAKQEILRRE